MSNVVQFRSRPQIPERAHRAARIASRFIKRSLALQAETKLAAIEAGVYSLAPTNVVPLRLPETVLRPHRMAGKYHRLAVAMLIYADHLADKAGVPKEGRATPAA
jgi:hypothetical protein